MITGQGSWIYAFSAAGDSLPGTIYLKHLRWVGATTAGHQLIVEDDAGNVIWESVADGQYMIDVFPFYRYITGINPVTMGSGTLYAYTAANGR